ncbi:MAG: hypothetical protein ACOC97_04995, partial [Myxococcota bacterium]
MRRAVLVLVVLFVGPAGPARAEARPYRGPHPVDDRGGWHFEQDVHVHDTLPLGSEPFGEVEGVLVFLGDPLAYGYDGAVWAYDGIHPIPLGDAYCGLRDVHRHPFPPEGDFRRDDGDTYRYVGALRGGVPTVHPGRVAPRGGGSERRPGPSYGPGGAPVRALPTALWPSHRLPRLHHPRWRPFVRPHRFRPDRSRTRPSRARPPA